MGRVTSHKEEALGELLWIVGIGIALYFLFRKSGDSSSGQGGPPPSRGTSSPRPRAGQPPAPPQKPNQYRPRASAPSTSGISFNTDTNAGTSTTLNEQVTDFLTGAKFTTTATTYQCKECFAFYSADSYDLLRSANDGQCASCRSPSLVALGGKPARNATQSSPLASGTSAPGVATLQNYKSFVGRVATFKGNVVKVTESRRGGDFAVMFEDKSWKLGFKLVFFKGALGSLGGPRYAQGLAGKTISIRGLIVNHPQFGYQIIVNQPGMILRVE